MADPNTLSSIGISFYHTAIAAANEVGNVMDVSGPNFARDVIDATSHSSPDDFKESIVGRWDGGEMTFDIEWDPQNTNHQFLVNQVTTSPAADDPKTYFLRFPSAPAKASFGSIEFKAHLVGFAPLGPVEGKLAASITLKVTGKPTITAVDATVP